MLDPLLGPGGRTGDDHSITIVDHGPLHQFGVLGKDRSDGVRRLVVRRIEAERLESGVLTNQVCGIAGQPGGQIYESVTIRGSLQIFDDVELDTGSFEESSNLARRASPTVEIQCDHAPSLGEC